MYMGWGRRTSCGAGVRAMGRCAIGAGTIPLPPSSDITEASAGACWFGALIFGNIQNRM